MNEISVSGKLTRLVKQAVKDDKITVDEKKEILEEIHKDGEVDGEEAALLEALDQRQDFNLVSKSLGIFKTTTPIHPLGLDFEAPSLSDLHQSPYFKLEPGQQGDSIQHLQKILQRLDYAYSETDATYTKATQNWIRNFQAEQGLDPTGEVDGATLKALEAAPPRTPSLEDISRFERARLGPGSQGEPVKDLHALIHWVDYRFQTPDTSLYSDETQDWIRDFQTTKGLEPTGDIDRKTLEALQKAQPQTPSLDEVQDPDEADYPNPDLQPSFHRGQQGTGIIYLNILLKKVVEGFDPQSSVFDETTEAAVRQFQTDNSLPETGVVDQETLGLMESATKLSEEQIYHPDARVIDGEDFASENERVKAILTNQLIERFPHDEEALEEAFALGDKLLVAAKKVDKQMASSSKCYTAVKRAAEKALGLKYKAYRGRVEGSYGSYARTADATYFKDYGQHFLEITGLTREDTRYLPPGAIVVYKPQKKSAAGHIGVQDGQGHDVSDKTRNQSRVHTTADFKVYFPIPANRPILEGPQNQTPSPLKGPEYSE